MEQHAIPRQITTFEFKLIGFFTIKQFLYLVVGAGFGLLAYFLIPAVSLVNFAVGGSVFGVFAAFALVKYNERSMDIWIKNLAKRLTSPSQYFFHKINPSPDFLKDVKIYLDPSLAASHIDARKKLNSYVGSPQENKVDTHRQIVSQLINKVPVTKPSQPNQKNQSTVNNVSTNTSPATTRTPEESSSERKKPFIVGVVKTKKEIPIPSIMIYVKSCEGKMVRILKTNSRGVFATFHPLADGEYSLEAKDLAGKYFFDTINFTAQETTTTPFNIYEKSLL